MRIMLFFLLLVITSCKSLSSDFEERTGLEIEESTSALVQEDTYFIKEGEYSLVFKTTKSQIRKWLQGEPPWENRKWSHGPVPHQIGFHCKFYFPERTGVSTDPQGNSKYSDDNELTKLLGDSSSYFVANQRCCDGDGLQFHSGDLLILQPDSGKVWYSGWDY